MALVGSALAAANAIRQFADNLPGPYGYEASVKFTDAAVAPHRFLVTFPVLALTLGADVMALLAELKFPVADLPRLHDMLKSGDIIHLGFEADAQRYFCKIYIESAQQARAMWVSSELPECVPINVHRALKWQSDDVQAIETYYDWLPCRSPLRLIEQMHGLCEWLSEDMLAELLAPLWARVPALDLQLLRVSEPSNQRQSFDLNCYDAELRVADIEAYLMAPVMLAKLGSLRQLRELDLSQQLLGHVAAGTTREGQPFLTIYYGGGEKGGFTHG